MGEDEAVAAAVVAMAADAMVAGAAVTTVRAAAVVAATRAGAQTDHQAASSAPTAVAHAVGRALAASTSGRLRAGLLETATATAAAAAAAAATASMGCTGREASQPSEGSEGRGSALQLE